MDRYPIALPLRPARYSTAWPYVSEIDCSIWIVGTKYGMHSLKQSNNAMIRSLSLAVLCGW